MKNKKGKGIAAVIALATFGVGAAVGSAASSTPKTVTHEVTTYVPGPTHTVQVPGHTVTVSAPAPASGTVLGTWSGTGNENTPAFNAPASGDYIVSWQFSGNVDPTLGQGTNFAITTTDQSAQGLGLPNDIASSGQGSTEVTGASGTESFNVQATGSWKITVKSAP